MPRKTRSISSRSTPTFAGAQRSVVAEFNPDYTNIKRDLKRIGVLAGSFFAILIAISIILPLVQR
jgi:hypothetical protein